MRSFHSSGDAFAIVRRWTSFLTSPGSRVSRRGLIQSYVAIECGDGWWADETDPGFAGSDQFLADESSLGRGLGTRMVSAFVRRLFRSGNVTKVR
jgi:hypothetical protein